jgi:protein-disulfide isomerase
MIARRTFALLPLVVLAAACSRVRSAPPAAGAGGDDQAVVARVNGQTVTRKEMDARAASTLERLRDEEYEARRNALEEIVNERLLDGEAASRKVSRDELMRQEVDGKVAAPTKEEVADLYAKNKDRVGGRTLAQMTPDIEKSIVQQRSAERAESYVEELRKKSKVQIALVQPRSEVPIPADARTLGPAKAPVTIVEFSDYLCPYCQRAQSVVDEVLAHNTGKVRFVHRDFLLGRPRSMAVARAAQCAADQGKFWDYRHNLLTGPGDWSDEDLVKRTGALGLDRPSFQACLASDKHDRAILDSSEEGTQLGVHSTPTFFVNGRRVRGVRSADQLQELIDSELQSGS